MKTAIVALMLAAVLLSPALAADHLYPEPSIFGGNAFMPEYQLDVVSVLKDAMDDDVILRMILMPSFIPESAVGIRKHGGQFEIFSLHPSEQVWGYRERHDGKVKIGPDGKIDGSEVFEIGRNDPQRMPVKTCSIQISQPVEDALAMNWELSLRAVHSDGDQESGADGAFYHFATRKASADRRYMSEFLAGQIWSGGLGPRVSALIDLAATLDQYCEARDAKTLDLLTAKAEAVLKVAH